MNRQDAKAPRLAEPGAAVDAAAREIVDSAFAVHAALGAGLLESVYEQCLAHELEHRGIEVQRQVAVPVRYRDVRINAGFRIDLIVADLVVVEVKAAETLIPIHEAQLLTYLKLSNHSLGLLINFNVPLIRQGIRRLILRT
ncbi:MAG: GxxExxY protein [Acetobacteraceae bacterium]|nr:GxxExxY protein [Acetobacteraceae bacterium]